ncbi:PAS domain S-box-containing protein [Aquimarina sp. EL_43]|uniref:Histidine kinase n=1 Tax=Aquimarina atlantica TaxID=1317122 RepID=A0A023BT74_9FLAO|nr:MULTISPECIES: PAS domain-containing protein [Aquimarina]EZH73129.1 histidine kinase [Aquimarina atlantica]MBG6128751.1 PAS domain S-box-containing protein [Aquimarina sp. EL_35]MBG6149814.1 PAS domain S-box-containing protein [Aquimarina sp. EL_32]MBG6167499.1 PAS domain S-box-containing protein [Aquimarina sp. EL_43]
MKALKRPEPINVEIVLDPKETIMSKTDPKGIIEYANDYFMEVCGYEEQELIGQPHNVIRHPDMPKIIFKWLWEHLLAKKNIHALVKNLAKDGRYYWVITDFDVKLDDEGQITSFFARRKAPPREAIEKIDKLYKKLLAIEQASGVETTEKYLVGFLEEKGMTYHEFIEEVCFSEETKPYDPKELQYHKRRTVFSRMFR